MDDKAYNEALKDPKAAFATPDAVVKSDLPLERKRAVLERWHADAEQLSAAEAEGMAGGEPAMLGDVERALASLDEGGPSGIGWDVVGIFHDRDDLERAIQDLQSHGFHRSQLSIVGTDDTLRERMGLETDPVGKGTDDRPPVDSTEEQNLGALVGAMPTFIGAAAAAGAVIATGGAAAFAIAAAVAGGAGGAAVGQVGARAIDGKVEGDYEQDLRRGGILLLVHPTDRVDIRTARSIIGRHADSARTIAQGSGAQ